MRRGIGVILEQERKKAGISLEVLCKGICSIGELNRIQNSEREPDKFLLDCLWARLGKGKEKLEIILSATDYFIYEMRNLIWKDFQNKNFAEMERKLCFYENMKEAQKPFHYQYICEIRALHAFQEKKEEALIEVKKAILYTIPDFPRDRFWECALSVDELRLVFLYFKITKQVDRKEKIRSYYKILNILEKNILKMRRR